MTERPRIGRRYSRLFERIGSAFSYLVLVLITLPFTPIHVGPGHVILALVVLVAFSAAGRTVGRRLATNRASGVAKAPERADQDQLVEALAGMNSEAAVRAVGSLPATAREAWLEAAGSLPHRCGGTIRDEVEQRTVAQPAVGSDGLAPEVTDLGARLEWLSGRTRVRLLALTPSLFWSVLVVLALAISPPPDDVRFASLVLAILVLLIAGMAIWAVFDERRGYRSLTTILPDDER